MVAISSITPFVFNLNFILALPCLIFVCTFNFQFPLLLIHFYKMSHGLSLGDKKVTQTTYFSACESTV